MKKIKVWVVLALSIITFGIYSIVWVARRRNEMVNNYKQTIPHWAWLIVPMFALIALAIPFFFFISLAASAEDNYANATASILIFVLLGAVATLSIYIWWFWQFSKAAAYVVNNKITSGWGLALYILAGSVTNLFLQYYFNRAAEPAERKKVTKPEKPSRNFIITAVIVLILSVVGAAATIPSAMQDFEELESETKELNAKSEEADRLLKEYNDCTAKLEADYPGEITEANEAAYTQAYNVCDEIYQKQVQATLDYNKALEN